MFVILGKKGRMEEEKIDSLVRLGMLYGWNENFQLRRRCIWSPLSNIGRQLEKETKKKLKNLKLFRQHLKKQWRLSNSAAFVSFFFFLSLSFRDRVNCADDVIALTKG